MAEKKRKVQARKPVKKASRAKKGPAPKKAPAKRKPAPQKTAPVAGAPEPPPLAPPPPAAAKPEPAFVGVKGHPLKPATEVPALDKDERRRLDEILDRYGRSDANLLGILQDIQDQNNYVPRHWVEALGRDLGIPRSRVYRLATFFRSLSLTPRGKHICVVCIGTTCHVRGAPKLVDRIELEMGIKAGDTTGDMLFTLETVGCVGACALGPLVVLDKKYHGNMTMDGLSKLVKTIKGKPATAEEEEE